jgi:hypothetical protein
MTLWKLALCATVAAAIAVPGFAADIEGPMLNAHNALRAKHGVPPLSWSASLAKTAQAWADRCMFEHSNAGLGENLAQGTGDYSGANAVNDWYGEISAYDFNNPGFSDATGHFTQVVWKDTKKVGCPSPSAPMEHSMSATINRRETLKARSPTTCCRRSNRPARGERRGEGPPRRSAQIRRAAASASHAACSAAGRPAP